MTFTKKTYVLMYQNVLIVSSLCGSVENLLNSNGKGIKPKFNRFTDEV